MKTNNLSAAVASVLKEYASDVTDAVQRSVEELAKEGVARVKSDSPVNPQGKKRGAYRSGWTKRVTVNRYGASAVIYNGKFPGLVHLLENGHALRNGGRVSGKKHVAPVQDWLNDELPRRIEEAIT